MDQRTLLFRTLISILFYLYSYICIYFILFSFFLLYIFYGKLNMMSNLAGWRHEQVCTRCVGYLPERTHLAWNKDARVKPHIHEAKLCICSAWFLVHLSSHGIKEHCVDDGVIVRYSMVVCFLSCKMLVDNKYSRNA